MAGKVPVRLRTVQFFEVLSSEDGGLKPLPDIPWDKTLSTIGGLPFHKRKVAGERDIFAAPHLLDGQRHLLIHKIKTDADWMHRADLTTGEVEELESSASQGFVDTSVVAFLSEGNVLGLMEGSAAAPSHRTLEYWLNRMNLFPDVTLSVEPIISPGEIARLSQGLAVQRLELKVSDKAQLAGAHGGLVSVFEQALNQYAPAVVTLSISMPRGKPKAADQDKRAKLLSDVLALGDVVSGVDRASVGLLFGEGDGYSAARMSEMVEHHMTAKRKVAAVDDEGNSLRIENALRAIVEELDASRDELLKNSRGGGGQGGAVGS